jgi:hypothetical protein
MLTTVLLWVQQQTTHGFAFTGDEIRTAMIGALLAIVGYIARAAGTVRDDVRDMKREIPLGGELVMLTSSPARRTTA